jgi:uncharacterized membrane protein
MKTKTLNTLLAGAVTVSTLGTSATANAMTVGEDQEKCYGVVKAGMNLCGSADKEHGCAGQATEDGSGVEWIALPKGTCEKLVGGSLEPIMPEDDTAEEKKEH